MSKTFRPYTPGQYLLHQKVLDLYATSIDYQPDTELSRRFFASRSGVASARDSRA